jgi:uncharacterized membrane protein YeaQ/YmgE (transglycosylase-associated protein family)
MSVEGLFVMLMVGLIAGWLAATIVKGGALGLVGSIVVGVVGAFIGGWLIPALGIPMGEGLLAAIVSATIGAVVLLLVLRLVRPA